MIKEIVDRFIAKKEDIAIELKQGHIDSYRDLVHLVISNITKDDDYDWPDPNRIHQIDDGDYQGTLVFVIAGQGYQPSEYWYLKISYGSCSVCDTLEQVKEQDRESGIPTSQQVEDYMTLSLHIAQGIKKMGDDSVE